MDLFFHFNSRTKSSKKLNKTPNLKASLSRRPTASLRSKLFRRYNPPPKAVPRSPVPAKVADILSNSEFKQRKQMASTSGSEQASAVQSDSESSDDGLVNPNEIDFNSEFFDVKTKDQGNQQQNNAPVFDCNAGMNLSDTSDDDNEEFDEVAPQTTDDSIKKPSIVDKINKKSSNEMHDFSSLQNFAKNLESAKAHLIKLKEKETSTSKTDESDITKLLSLGEGAPVSKTPSRKRKHKDGKQSDDSDWENVSGKKKKININ